MSRTSTLLRLRKWELDEKRASLGTLLRRRAETEQEILDLDEVLIAEQAVACGSIEAARAYARFAGAVKQRKAKIGRKRDALDREIAVAQDEVTAAFQEFKRVEVVHGRKLDAEREERGRREQMELDEVAQDAHRRKVRA